MTFSKEWEERFKDNTHQSVWPWSDVVSYFHRYAKDSKNVLELGCGVGANIPFFKSTGIEYCGMEGSKFAVDKIKQRFPEINVIVGDFTQEIPINKKFDLIFDRSSLTHNTEDGIKQCLKNVYVRLADNGKYIGIDWFSTSHSDYAKGKDDTDQFTKTGYHEGQFASVGRVHFSNKEHLLDLFKDFNILILEHKSIKTEIPSNEKNFASWNFVAQKRF